MDLREVQLRKKRHLGSGMFQTTYEIVSRPNMVVKTKKDGEPYDEVEMKVLSVVSGHPDLFAKIYIIRPKFVVMEKLNTENAVKIYRKAERAIDRFMGSPGEFRYILEEWYSMGESDFYDEYGELYDHLNENGVLYAFEEIAELFSDTMVVFEDYVGGKPDFHEGNIGYCDRGMLKMLDW